MSPLLTRKPPADEVDPADLLEDYPAADATGERPSRGLRGLRPRLRASRADSDPEVVSPTGRLAGLWPGMSTSEGSSWTAGDRLGSRVATVAVVVCLLAGPVALVKSSMTGDAPAAPTSSGYDQRMMSRRTAATDLAVHAVMAWLQADQDHTTALSQYWDTAQLPTLPTDPMHASSPTVYGATPTAPGVWSVEMSAVVTPAGGGAARRRYFDLPVAVSGSRNVAAQPLALPAEVAAPSRAVSSVSLGYGSQVPQDSRVFTAVQGFLSAMLAGKGPIALYTRPGVSIPAVSPAPWASVTVTEVDTAGDGTDLVSGTQPDGARIHVLASVELNAPRSRSSASPSSTPGSKKKASKNSGPAWPGAPAGSDAGSSVPVPAAQPAASNPVPAQYLLTLTARSGRWEVSAINTAPSTGTSTAPSN